MTDKFEIAYKEFHDKTDWIQDEMNDGSVKGMYWGMHRADAIKALVDSLRDEIKQKDEIIAGYRSFAIDVLSTK